MPVPPSAPPIDPPLLQDAIHGLAASPRRLPSKYFYDEEGSRFFDAITELEAYYPTRTEQRILEDNLDAIADQIGENAVLIEYGSGSSTKTQLLLDRLSPQDGRSGLASYVPIDISEEHLLKTANALRAAYPTLRIEPVAADYTQPFTIPDDPDHRRKRVVFFPGSTIGNFEPQEAQSFLAQIADVAGPGGGLLIGVDRKKDVAVLERAYDDPEGVTAAFNRNLLVRLNREVGADFDLDRWAHKACYNSDEGRVEMHLVSLGDQTVHLGGQAFSFQDGETIHTENSYKYAPGELEALADNAGLTLVHDWADERHWFGVSYYTVRGS